MHRTRSLLLLTGFLLLHIPSFSQVDKEFDSLVNEAESFIKIKKYDSALIYNLKAVKLTLDSKDPSLASVSHILMLSTGRCYKEINDMANAHRFMTHSLRLARANKMPVDVGIAFTELNMLHRDIAAKNLVFHYPAVTATEEISMFFPITKVERLSKDSLRVTIQGGRLDGITDSVFKGGIISKYESDSTERPFGLVNAHIRELHNNYIIAHAVNDSLLPVLTGDIVELKTRIPLTWRKLDITQNVLYGIILNSNLREPVYSSRYLYYYTDSLTNQEIADILKYQLEEIVSVLGEDTTTGTYLNYKSDRGIFAGEHVMRALSKAKPEHIRLFLSFMNAFPRKYLGSSYKFSEMFATWAVSNTPMAGKEVMPWLLQIRDRKERQVMAYKLADDIQKNELIDRWFNDGMLMANADNIDSAFYMADLIKDACIALKDPYREGWAGYLSAYTEKKLGNYKRADTLYRDAAAKFKATSNKEGEIWATNALKNLSSSREVAVTLKTGHVFQYIMAPSPNSRYLATAGSYDKLIKIWDIKQGRTVASFSAHTDGINSINYSPNGRYLVSSSDDKTIRVWNAYDLSLLNTITRPEAELDVIFTPDSKQLVAGGHDSLVKFIDLNSGKVLKTFKKHRGSITSLCFSPINSNFLYSSGSDSLVYKWDIEKNDWDHWYSAPARIMNVDLTNDGKYMSLVCADTLIRVWRLDRGKFYFSIRPNYTRGGNVDIAFPSFTPDSRYMAMPLKNDTLDIINLATLEEQTYGFKTEGYQGMFDVVFSPDGSYLAVRVDLGGPLRILNFAGWDFHTNKFLNVRDLEQYANIPLAVQFSKDDKQLNVVHEAISRVDLRNGSTSHLYEGSFIFMNSHVLLNDEKTGLYADPYGSSIKFYDFTNKKDILEVSLTDKKEELRRFELSADNTLIFLGGIKTNVAAFSLPSGKMLFAKKYDTGDERGVTFLRYDSLRKQLFLITRNDKILILDALTGEIKGSILGDKPQSVEATPRYLYVTCDNSMVYKFDARTLQLLKKIKVHKSGMDCYGSVMSRDHRYLVVQVEDVFVTLDTRTDKVLYQRYDHDYANGTMSISHNNKLLATGGFDSRIHLYNLVTGKKISTIYTPKGKDFMLVDDEGNYLAPKNTLEAVSFSFNNNSYGFEQFDSRFNRPDIVLKKIGAADSSLINTYRAAWRKRLKKLNINEKDLGAEIHLPVVRLKDKFAIKAATSLTEYELHIECYDAKYPLRSLQVMVNNNPLFGTAGKSIEGNTTTTSMSVKVPLNTGVNMVKVYCTNSKGTASLAEYIEINGTYTPAEKPKTYFIGIAVSNYKDTSMNLRFAAKDVRDLAASFGRMSNNFQTDTLIDVNATRENILALRQKLMHTNVNDKVIISVNGHGLLNDSLDFYYATYDMDFKTPAARGLKYEDLEALLDGIPARKKLLLIDACHSGALDKDELIAQQQKEKAMPKNVINKADTVKGFAARGTITKSNKSSVDANSTYEVMQHLFADLSSGNGAVIISAAGGMEYAFESDTWNNGVFTYCIRKGLEEDLADKQAGDSNKFVEVSELKDYVSRKVSELTNGKQRPVSRRENIEFNWVVW